LVAEFDIRRPRVTAIIAAAGMGRRLGAGVPKQLLEIGNRTILQRSFDAFAGHPRVRDVIVVLPVGLAALPDELAGSQLIAGPGNAGVRVVAGGSRRQDSVANAFREVPADTEIVLVHDAARPFVSDEVISRAIDAAVAHGAAVVAQPVSDTVKRVRAGGGTLEVVETLPRELIFLAQTPQAFRRDVLRDAITLGASGVEATDEAALAERAGHTVHIVEGSPRNVKITTMDDLDDARRRYVDRPVRIMTERVGTGYDLHRLAEGRRLMLGGVEVPSPFGGLGHSDADVVCHATTDALLGAACLGDIGQHFPDTEARWKDANSLDLLRHAVALVHTAGFRVVNLDVVVVLERPKIGPFVDTIRASLAGALEILPRRVSVKGKTNEGVDAVGRGEAIAAHAVALLTSAS
jgi:2-C-methyl-D-erythritol 4-phosphate cytidylyltransferase/2-C-methyl-D-erythritol 2,4-cyclodiphosphate synthase